MKGIHRRRISHIDQQLNALLLFYTFRENRKCHNNPMKKEKKICTGNSLWRELSFKKQLETMKAQTASGRKDVGYLIANNLYFFNHLPRSCVNIWWNSQLRFPIRPTSIRTGLKPENNNNLSISVYCVFYFINSCFQWLQPISLHIRCILSY